MLIAPVILLGGSGTRLWPVSRKNHPKQFLNLTGEQTLLQATISRLEGIEGLQKPLILCNEEHRFTAAEQLHNMGCTDSDIILEPVGRNTAPAVAIAALRALEKNDDALLLVLPADHVIQNEAAFHNAIAIAKQAATDNSLVTFGIVPKQAETGYGYIRRGESIGDSLYKVDKFVEKPDLETALDMSNPVIITGIAACLCLKLQHFWTNWKNLIPRL